MCRYSAPPGYVRSKAPERPKLGPLVPVIDAILEADKTAPPKQRHTAKRIFERLRIEHGYAGGYTVVKDYVRIARTRSREAFVPLAHPPGHAQVDFGECIGVIGGVRMKLRVFCFDLPQSDACFIKSFVTLAGFTCFYCLPGESPATRFQCLSLASPRSITASTCSM
jgi:transposase